MQNNNYIATIVNKHLINDNLYLFTYDHSITGDFDEKKEIFIDSFGNEFLSISDFDFLFSDLQKGFINTVSFDAINKALPNVKEKKEHYLTQIYDEHSKNKIFFVEVFEEEDTDEYFHTVLIEQDVKDIINNVVSSLDVDKENYQVSIKSIIENDKEELSKINKLIDDNSEEDEVFDIMDLFEDGEIETAEKLALEELGLESSKSKIQERNKEILGITSVESEVETLPIDLEKIRKNIKRKLINQDDPLRRLTTELVRMQLKDNEKNKGILLVGDTGTGKSFMMKLIAEELKLPFLEIDSTQLTVPGYVGKDIEVYLWDLYESCGKNIEKAEKAIVFFDEIDKKGSSSKSDISGQGVLNLLLKFLDGTTYDATEDVQYGFNKVKINTKGMIVIAAGAFTDVFSDYQSKPIGFSNSSNESDSSSNEMPGIDEFTKKGCMPEEFMGRFPIKIKLNKMDENSYARVLLESEESVLKEEQNTFAKLGVKLTASPEYIKGISKRAIKLKTGIRGLMDCVERSTWEALEDIYLNPGKYEEIILNEKTIDDTKVYQKVLKKNI